MQSETPTFLKKRDEDGDGFLIHKVHPHVEYAPACEDNPTPYRDVEYVSLGALHITNQDWCEECRQIAFNKYGR